MAKYENPAELDYRNGGDTVDDFAQKYMRTVDYIIKALNDLRTPTGNTAGVEPEPYMWRIADNKLYIRNADNTDYVLLGDISPNFGFRQSVNDRFLTTADLEGEGAVVTRNEAGKVEGDITGSPGKIANKTIDVTPTADNDVIAYDAAQQKWVKKTLNDYLKKQGDAGWDEMVDEVADQVIEDITPIIFNFWYLDDDGYLVPLVGSTEGGLPSIHGMVGDYEQITARSVDVAGNLSATGNVTAGMVTTPQANVTTLTANAVNAGTVTANSASVTEISAGTVTADDIIAKGPVVDVRAFGAKGDGVTDDTAAIQAAIDYAQNNHMVCYLPNQYAISDTLIVQDSNIVLQGLSRYHSQIIQKTNGIPVIKFIHNYTVVSSGISVDDIAFGYATRQTSGEPAVYFTHNGDNDNWGFAFCRFNLKIFNAYIGMSSDGVTPLWECEFDIISQNITRQLIKLVSNGQLCNHFRNISMLNDYSAGGNSATNIDCVQLTGETVIDNLDIEDWYGTALSSIGVLGSCSVKNAHFERCTLGTNGILISASDALTIDNIVLADSTFGQNSKLLYTLSDRPINIGSISDTYQVTYSGDFYLVIFEKTLSSGSIESSLTGQKRIYNDDKGINVTLNGKTWLDRNQFATAADIPNIPANPGMIIGCSAAFTLGYAGWIVPFICSGKSVTNCTCSAVAWSSEITIDSNVSAADFAKFKAGDFIVVQGIGRTKIVYVNAATRVIGITSNVQDKVSAGASVQFLTVSDCAKPIGSLA